MRLFFIFLFQTVELCDKLRIDIANQPRYILNDTNVLISLQRATDQFVLMHSVASGKTNKKPKIKMMDASFFIRKQLLFPSIILAHQKILSQGETAKYPLKKTGVKYFTVSKGVQSFTEENAFQSQIPDRIVLAMVSNASFNGSYTTSPYVFSDFGLASLSICVNNIPVPIRPLVTNFTGSDYILPYYLLFTSLGIAGKDHGLIFDRTDFTDNGYALFPFDLRPISGNDQLLQLSKSGSVKIDLKFRNGLSDAVTLLVYYETNGMIEIDQYRQVTKQ